MDSAIRSNQDKFLMEKVEVIVATIAFGMGIDKPDVATLFTTNSKKLGRLLPETGRAGRDGGEGQCITFIITKTCRNSKNLCKGNNFNRAGNR